MSDRRKHDREICYAKCMIDKVPGYVRDISRSGMRVDLISRPGTGERQKASCEIIPDPATGIPDFDLSVTVRWTRMDRLYFSLGAEISELDPSYAAAFDELMRYYAQPE